jgi:hypothetical protein
LIAGYWNMSFMRAQSVRMIQRNKKRINEKLNGHLFNRKMPAQLSVAAVNCFLNQPP